MQSKPAGPQTPAIPAPNQGRRVTLTGQLEEAELAQTTQMELHQGCPPSQPLGGQREARGQSPPRGELPQRRHLPGVDAHGGTGEQPGLLPGQAGAGPGQAAWRARESSLAVLQKLNLELAHGPSHSWVHTRES